MVTVTRVKLYNKHKRYLCRYIKNKETINKVSAFMGHFLNKGPGLIIVCFTFTKLKFKGNGVVNFAFPLNNHVTIDLFMVYI